MRLQTIGRREKTLKKAILRNVFKENLKMVGELERHQKNQKKSTAILLVGSLILLGIAVIHIMNSTILPKNSFRHYRELKMTETAPVQTETDTGNRALTLPQQSPDQYRTFLNQAQTPLSRIFGLKIKTIIIDPGHGGRDPGAVGRLGTREKNITLDIALKLQKKLEKFPEYRILLTRESDTYLTLEQRAAFANNQKADLFISIHVNVVPSDPSNIIETYYFGPNADEKTLLLVEQENRGAQYTASDFKEIIQKIGNTLKTQESGQLATHIQRSLYRNISRRNGDIENWGVRKAPFIVLLAVDTPSVLTEVTCLSNSEEEIKLKKESYRDEIAGFLEEGIVRYLNNNHNNQQIGGE